MPLREPMSPYWQDRLHGATAHGVISQECTNKGRTLLFDLDYGKIYQRRLPAVGDR